jgi:hypothetical protein
MLRLTTVFRLTLGYNLACQRDNRGVAGDNGQERVSVQGIQHGVDHSRH